MKHSLRLLSICTLIFFLAGSMAYAANNKVGFINLQRLVNESKMGKSAREDILKLRRQKEKAVAAQQVHRPIRWVEQAPPRQPIDQPRPAPSCGALLQPVSARLQ